MKYKKSIPLLFILVVSLIPFLSNPVSSTLGYVIDKNTVYVDDVNAYIAVYPHTTSGGWVYLNLTSKHYSGNVDVLFGFDTEFCFPKCSELYKPGNISTERNYQIPNKYFTDSNFKANWTFTSQDSQFLYDGEGFLWRYEEANITHNACWVLEWTHVFTKANKLTKTVYWNDVQHREWLRLTKEKLDWKLYKHEYEGMDTWYYFNVDLTAQIDYHVRIWLEIDPNKEYSGKYWVAFKPSHETLHESITYGHLYVLDPWFSSSWDYRTEITIDHNDVASNLTDFPVYVYLNSSRIDWTHVQDDLDDLRFTNADNSTVLKYEIESYTANTDANIWVKIDNVDSGADTTFYMYYGNDGASSGEDPENVWDSNYMAVWHMNDYNTSAILDSTSNNNDGAKAAANKPVEATGKMGKAQDFEDASSDMYINAGSDPSLDFNNVSYTLEAWYKGESFPGASPDYADVIIQKGTNGAATGVWLLGLNQDTDARTMVYEGGFKVADSSTISLATWYYLVGTWDKAHLDIYVDKANTEGAALTSKTVVDADVQIGRSGENNYEYYLDGLIDELRVSNGTRNDAWINATYESGRDDFLTYGSEEANNADPTIGDFRTEILLDSANLIGSSVYLHYAATSIGQAFKPKANGSLTTAQLYLNKHGSPTGTAYVELYSTTGTYGTDATPSGSVLATSEGFDVSTLTSGVYAWKTFVFNSTEQYSIVKDTAYFLVFNQSACTISYWNCVVTYKGTDKSNGAEHDGNLATYHMIGSDPWTGADGHDLNFMVYGNVSSPILYGNELCFIQATINDADGVAEFVNATVALNQSIILKWANTTDTYSENQDTYSFCTLVTPTPSPTITVNASAYTLKWHVKINNYNLSTSDVLAANTKVYDTNDASGSGSTTGLFTYNQGYYITWDIKDHSTETRIPDATVLKMNSGNGTTITDSSANGLHSSVRVSAGKITVVNVWWGEYVTVPSIDWLVNENETFTDLSPVRRLSSGDYYLLVAGNFTDIGDDPERTSGSDWKMDNAHLKHVVVYDTRTVIVNLTHWLTTSEPYKIIMYGNDYVRGSDVWSYSNNAVVIDVFKLLGSGGDWTGYLEMTWGEPEGPPHGSIYIPPEPEPEYEEFVEDVQEVAEETQKDISVFLGESPYPGMVILAGIVAVVFLYGQNTVKRKNWRKKGKSPTKRRKKAKQPRRKKTKPPKKAKWRQNNKFKG